MRTPARLLAGIGIWLVIFVLAAQGVPSIPPLRRLVETTPWLSSSDITQLVFLGASLAAMLSLSRGKGSLYGLCWSGRRQLTRAVGAASCVALGFAAVSVAGSLLGAEPTASEGAHGPMAYGFVKLVVSVWIVASISEEMLFRGFLQGFLSPLAARGFRLFRVRISLPVTVAAVLFGLVHVALLRFVPPPMVGFIVVMAMVVGFMAGYYRERTGSVVPAIGIHMVFNVIGAGVPMAFSRVVGA